MRYINRKTAIALMMSLCMIHASAYAQDAKAPKDAAGKDAAAGEERTEPVTPDGKPSHLKPLLKSVPIFFSGYFWADTGYMERSIAHKPDEKYMVQQGRFCLAAAYYQQAGSFYGLAKVEYLGHVNESGTYSEVIDTLDSYVQFGWSWLDLQVGRFLAWELYHKGQGLELYTLEDAGANGPDLYELDFTRGHGNEVGQFALHAYPLDFLKIEMAGVYGNESDANYYGFRPVVDMSWWHLQLVSGFEYLHGKSTKSDSKVDFEKTGYGFRLQFNSGVFTGGACFARATTEYTDIQGKHDTMKSYTITSYGGFADIDFWRNSIGLGYHYTLQEFERGDKYDHIQPFVSYLFRLPVRGLSVKFVFAMAIANFNDMKLGEIYKNDMYTGRIRIAYEFQ